MAETTTFEGKRVVVTGAVRGLAPREFRGKHRDNYFEWRLATGAATDAAIRRLGGTPARNVALGPDDVLLVGDEAPGSRAFVPRTIRVVSESEFVAMLAEAA
jgi:hypothetical protein